MKCEECGETTRYEIGVCEACGLVFDDNPIIYNELSFYGDSERKEQERTSSFIKSTSPDIGFFTTSDIKKTTNKELKRALLNAKRRPRLYGQPEHAQRFYTAWAEINRLCSILKLSNDIFENSIIMLKELMKNGFIERSYKKFACYAALVIISARLLNRLPIRIFKVAEYSDESIKNIRKAYDDIRKELNIGVNPFYLDEIVRYNGFELGLTEFEINRCINFANQIKPVGGRDLYGYAAGVIRIVTRLPRMEISKKLGVSEPIITARVKEMRKND